MIDYRHILTLAIATLTFSSQICALEKQGSSSKLISFQADKLAALNYLPKLERFVYHTVSRFISETVIELEDGSQWKTSLQDASELLSWRSHDWITITPKQWFQNEYSFYMNNYTAGSWVEVNLAVGPVEGGQYSNKICGMDLAQGKIYLSNGTYWQVAQNELDQIQEWVIGQPIIIGSNDSWMTAYTVMLINVNLNQYAFAKEI